MATVQLGAIVLLRVEMKEAHGNPRRARLSLR
jgi:hypothetical protein